jgi:excisionase family DNA binding protein
VRRKPMLAGVGVRDSGRSQVPAPTTIGMLPDEGSRAEVVLLTEPEVAERLRVSLACLRRWRLERRGPRFLKLGSLVRYPADELNTWIASLPVGGSAPGPVSSAPRQARGMVNA